MLGLRLRRVFSKERLSVESQLMQSLLDKITAENTQLRIINKKLEEDKVSIRDTIAAKIFSEIYTAIPTPEKAAEDAFKIADSFMRVRDLGKSYREDIVETLTFFASTNPNDSDLGAKIRSYLKELV